MTTVLMVLLIEIAVGVVASVMAAGWALDRQRATRKERDDQGQRPARTAA